MEQILKLMSLAITNTVKGLMIVINLTSFIERHKRGFNILNQIISKRFNLVESVFAFVGRSFFCQRTLPSNRFVIDRMNVGKRHDDVTSRMVNDVPRITCDVSGDSHAARMDGRLERRGRR